MSVTAIAILPVLATLLSLLTAIADGVSLGAIPIYDNFCPMRTSQLAPPPSPVQKYLKHMPNILLTAVSHRDHSMTTIRPGE